MYTNSLGTVKFSLQILNPLNSPRSDSFGCFSVSRSFQFSRCKLFWLEFFVWDPRGSTGSLDLSMLSEIFVKTWLKLNICGNVESK